MEIILSEIYDLDKIKIKEVKCPQCRENIFINFNNYKMNLLDCKNNHYKNDILFNDFMKTQKTDKSYLDRLTCSSCYKTVIYQDTFYKCINCNINLCPSCKEKHNKTHQMIDYNEINVICNEHNGVFNKYCKICKKNICNICEEKHMNHSFINFKDTIPNKESLIKEENNLKENIERFKNDIRLIIYKLNTVINNIEIYYKIYHELIESFNQMNHKNYHIIKNINEFNKYNKTIIEDMNKATNNKNEFEKFNYIINLYKKNDI